MSAYVRKHRQRFGILLRSLSSHVWRCWSTDVCDDDDDNNDDDDDDDDDDDSEEDHDMMTTLTITMTTTAMRISKESDWNRVDTCNVETLFNRLVVEQWNRTNQYKSWVKYGGIG